MFLFPYTIYIWCIINADKCPDIYLPLVKNCVMVSFIGQELWVMVSAIGQELWV